MSTPDERGERGLSRLQGRAVVVLFLIAVLSSAGGWFWQAREVDVNRAQFHAQQAAQQRQAAAAAAGQRREGAAVERKLCTTLGRLAALTPPPGSAADNPSRAYEQALHAVLAQLGPDVGCKEGNR